MKNIHFWHILICFLFIPFISFSQNSTTTIKGIVIDSTDQEGIPYATVRVTTVDNKDKVVKVAAADEKGKLNFQMTGQGEHIMTIQFVGKKNLEKKFILDQKVIDLGNLLMTDDSEMLGEVVVTAQKPLVKVDLDKITYSMADDPESKTNNLLEMLKKVPMVTVDGDENVQLKGSSNYKIYMNGKPSNLISNNPKDVLKSIPANTIKDIEVITDPGAKYDAEGVTGIINIITEKQSSLGGYTASVSGDINDLGGYGIGGYLSLKVGKIGFTGNYRLGEHKSAKGHYSSFREDLTNSPMKYLTQNSTTKNNGTHQFGYGELSYEIDTLNLLSFSFNRYYGKYNSKNNMFAQMEDVDNAPIYSYNSFRRNKGTYGGTDLNFDYQRTFSVKDRLLTASYRFSDNPNDSESSTDNQPEFNYNRSKYQQFSDAGLQEHTFQIDFTTPFAKIHTLESGLKYIRRNNKSTSGNEYLGQNEEWITVPSVNDRFKHEQDIFSAYAGYSVKVKKIGFKTGLRYETTDMKASYPLNTEQNFKTDYKNLIPSATISYQLDQSQSFRLGYNLRIWRPSIWYLNPYVNTSDSNYISQGNPNLDVVKSHNIGLNYSLYKAKFNMNVNLSSNFENNSIESITELIDGISYSTYDNIGKKVSTSLSAYINWTISSKIRLYSNLYSNYADIRTNNEQKIHNSGFESGIYSSLQFTLPKSVRINAYGGYNQGYLELQGRGSDYNFHGFSVGKGFLNDKLNFNISVRNPLTKNITFKNTQNMPTFRFSSESERRTRGVALSVSYRFGEMKAQIKKAQRGISNDDSMGGGNNSGGAGGGSPQ